MAKSGFVSTRARIKLRRILTETDSGIKPAMQDIANNIHKEMVRRAPKDTGKLVNNISAYVAKNGLRAEIGFRGKKAKRDAFYARMIEFGTKSHIVNTKSGTKVLSGNGTTYGTRANHPGTPARPFMWPTWAQEKPRTINTIRRVVNDAIKKASQL
jgi:HK97 gp10 family phage protein